MGSKNIITDVFTQRNIPRARQAEILSVPGLIGDVVDSVPEEKKHFVARHFLEAIATLKPMDRAKVTLTEGVQDALSHATKKHAKPAARVSHGHGLPEKPVSHRGHGLQENFGKPSPALTRGSGGGPRDPQVRPVSECRDPLLIPPKREFQWFAKPARSKDDGTTQSQKLPSQNKASPFLAMRRVQTKVVHPDLREKTRQQDQLCEDVLSLPKEERMAALKIGTILSDVWGSICASSPDKQATALSVDGLLLEILATGSDRRQQRVATMLRSFPSNWLKVVLRAEGAQEALTFMPDKDRKSLQRFLSREVSSATSGSQNFRALAVTP